MNMKNFAFRLAGNFGRCFAPHFLPFHLLAIISTYYFATTGFDWWIYSTGRANIPFTLVMIAGFGGFLVPVLLPAVFYGIGYFAKEAKMRMIAFALAHAGILGVLLSWFYKAFTGRAHPDLWSYVSLTDVTHQFQFGFLKGGVLWGWPSSHTTVAFAMAITLALLYKKNNAIRVPVLLWACFVGFGASVGFHWPSDVLAGVIFGTIVGMVVAKSYITSTR